MAENGPFGTPLSPQKIPRKSLCGSLFCVLSQELRQINISSGGPKSGVLGGGQKACWKSWCAFSVPLRIPHKKKKLFCGWLAWNFQFRLKISIPVYGDLPHFFNLFRCFLAPPSMRNRRSQFSAISTVFPQMLIDFQSISIAFLSFSISFGQFQSIWISCNRFLITLTRSKTIVKPPWPTTRKTQKTSKNDPGLQECSP